ncbi:hypothetical protein Tco_1079642 [Tanacetum coccineum]|uniref:Reverse transcriptase domain-containing protein n=1 Tax=Tanacetum coccineum TaxID=301880 RepID=A0ABQ5HSG1_9ASTR
MDKLIKLCVPRTLSKSQVSPKILPKVDQIDDEVLESIDSIPPGIDSFDAEFDLLESLLHRDTSINDSQKIDSLLDEFHRMTLILDGVGSIPTQVLRCDDFDSKDDDNSTSRPEFESFHVDYPYLRDSTVDVVEDILVDVPYILAPPSALKLDFEFIPSNDLGSDLDVSSPSEDRNKIYDPRICH